jgi:hypothetical protein
LSGVEAAVPAGAHGRSLGCAAGGLTLLEVGLCRFPVLGQDRPLRPHGRFVLLLRGKLLMRGGARVDRCRPCRLGLLREVAEEALGEFRLLGDGGCAVPVGGRLPVDLCGPRP